jgi:tRNA threonylcarbamoyladenosine biosynthesis protein TsaB
MPFVMRILGVDTSGDAGSLGLWREDGASHEAPLPADGRHGEHLIPTLERLLQRAGADRTAIDLIAVAIGPGSFTGLRIGLATMKGLARGLAIPLVGVPTLAAYARAAEWDGAVWSTMPDRGQFIYAQPFRRTIAVEEPIALPLAALMDRLKRDSSASQEAILVVGPAAERHRSTFESVDRLRCAEPIVCRPSGLRVARQGGEAFEAEGRDELIWAEPLYVQPAPGERGNRSTGESSQVMFT